MTTRIVEKMIGTLTKGVVGLSNVDNTSDLNKPISTLGQQALNAKANLLSPAFTGTPTIEGAVVETRASRGVANGYAALGSDGKIPSINLPDNGSYKGNWNASTNSPTIVAGTGTNGDTYTVSTAGTQSVTGSSIAFTVGDQLRYTTNGNKWERIPNTQLVSSVAGLIGTIQATALKTALVLVKADVGLSNVDNTSDANKPVSTAMTTALAGKEAFVTSGTTAQYYRGDKSWQTLNKSVVGLANVDNTSDVSKPVSTAQAAAISQAIEARITFVTPEMFGAGSTSDDTAAFRAMLSGTVRDFLPDPSKTYNIRGQLDFGRVSRWHSNLNFNVTGSRSDSGASLGVQTGGGTQHLSVLFIQGDHEFKDISVSVTKSISNPWLAIIRNDYYLNSTGGRPAYKTKFRASKIDVKVDSYVTGYSGDGNAAVCFQAMDEITVGDIWITNFQHVLKIGDINYIKTGNLNAFNARSGFQFTRCGFASIGNVYFEGNTTSPEYVAGANSILLRGMRAASVGDIWAYDTGEHGVRVVSQAANPGSVGLVELAAKTNASFGKVKIYRPGGCGFKVASGGDSTEDSEKIGAVSVSSIYVEDAGTNDYNTGGTFTGNNHFGLNVQNADSFSCTNAEFRRVTALHNGKHNALMRRIDRFYIGNFIGEGAYSCAIFWNCTAGQVNRDIFIGGGSIFDFGRNGTSSGILFLEAYNSANVYIKMNISNGPSLVEFSGTSTAPVSPWKLDITYSNVTSSTVTTNLSVTYGLDGVRPSGSLTPHISRRTPITWVTGSSLTILGSNLPEITEYSNHTSSINSFTIILPVGKDGQKVNIRSRSAVVNLSLSSTNSAVFYGAPTSLPTGGAFTMEYVLSENAWYRSDM